MQLSGSFTVAASCRTTYAFLTTPERVAAALPDTDNFSLDADDSFTVTTTVGVGFVRGRMNVRMRVVDRQPDERAVFTGRGQGMGSTVDLEARFDLLPAAGDGTEVNWRGTATVGGRLTSIAGGLLEPMAMKNIAQFVEMIRQELNSAK